jgi:predicted SAM-dependent methyltransferase
VRRSTRRKAGKVYYAGRALLSHLARQFRYRGELKAYCAGKSALLLNVGCGQLIHELWVNIDYEVVPGRSFYFDALDLLPLVDASVRHIHCEHFLEHLEHRDALRFLRECNRVLDSGGTMRVIVPDAERYMRAYVANDLDFFDRLVNLGGHQEPLRPKNLVCNQMFRMWGEHLFAWDFESLDAAARSVGFSEVRRSSHNDVEPEYAIDGGDWWRPFESLYANLHK